MTSTFIPIKIFTLDYLLFQFFSIYIYIYIYINERQTDRGRALFDISNSEIDRHEIG